jgi:hypothetical protein
MRQVKCDNISDVELESAAFHEINKADVQREQVAQFSAATVCFYIYPIYQLSIFFQPSYLIVLCKNFSLLPESRVS